MRRVSILLFFALLCTVFTACQGEVRRAIPSDLDGDIKKQASACDKGDLHACHNVAVALMYHPEGTAEHKALARDLLQRACAEDVDLSCRQLTEMENDGDDDDQRHAILLRTCERGDRDACVKLAQRRIEAGEHETAMLELNSLCKKRSIHACIELGRQLFQGDPSIRNPEQAISILNGPCGNGSPVACRLRSEAQLSIATTEADISTNIVKQLGEACLAAEERACRVLAGLYDAGVGVEKDPDYALSLLRRACDIPAPTSDCNKIVKAPALESQKHENTDDSSQNTPSDSP